MGLMSPCILVKPEAQHPKVLAQAGLVVVRVTDWDFGCQGIYDLRVGPKPHPGTGISSAPMPPPPEKQVVENTLDTKH